MVIAALALLVVALQQNRRLIDGGDKPLTYTAFLNLIEQGNNINVVHLKKDTAEGEYKSKPLTAQSNEFTVNIPTSGEAQNLLEQKLKAANISFDFPRPWLSDSVQALLFS